MIPRTSLRSIYILHKRKTKQRSSAPKVGIFPLGLTRYAVKCQRYFGTKAENKPPPVTLKLQSNSSGAGEYEWTFEVGMCIYPQPMLWHGQKLWMC